MMPGSDEPSGPRVPNTDSRVNVRERDVVGSKADASYSGPNASVISLLRKNMEYWGETGPFHSECEMTEWSYLNSYIVYSISLVDMSDGGLVPSADITPGSIDVIRIRAGVETTIESGSSFVKKDGLLYYIISLDDVNYQDDDAVKVIENTVSQVTIGATTYDVLLIPQVCLIVDLGDISTQIDNIETIVTLVELQQHVPIPDSIVNLLERDVVGNKEDTPVIQPTNQASIEAYVKGILTLHNVPNPDSIANSFLRDVVGNKEDTAITESSNIASVMAYLKGIIDKENIQFNEMPSDEYIETWNTDLGQVPSMWNRWTVTDPVAGSPWDYFYNEEGFVYCVVPLGSFARLATKRMFPIFLNSPGFTVANTIIKKSIIEWECKPGTPTNINSGDLFMGIGRLVDSLPTDDDVIYFGLHDVLGVKYFLCGSINVTGGGTSEFTATNTLAEDGIVYKFRIEMYKIGVLSYALFYINEILVATHDEAAKLPKVGGYFQIYEQVSLGINSIPVLYRVRYAEYDRVVN